MLNISQKAIKIVGFYTKNFLTFQIYKHDNYKHYDMIQIYINTDNDIDLCAVILGPRHLTHSLFTKYSKFHWL